LTTDSTILTEFFPVQIEKLSQLFAYELSIGESNVYTIGGKLSYRLRKIFEAGRWVWSNYNIVSDTLKSQCELNRALERFWSEEPETFSQLHKITPKQGWQPSPKEIADYVNRGVLTEFSYKIRQKLRENRVDLGNAYVERDYESRGWVVQGEPAVSISILSNLIYKKDLKEYASTVSAQDNLLDIWVLVKAQNFKGKIIDVVGTVKKHRTRLLTTSRSEEIKEIIENASDDELVVKIQAGQNEYDYVVSALNVILTMGDLSKFGVDPRKASNALRIAPSLRHEIITEVSKVLKKDGITPYNSKTHPQLFLTAQQVNFEPKLRFGNNQIRVSDEKSLMQNLQSAGVYRRSEQFNDKPISVGLIDARVHPKQTSFSQQIKNMMKHLSFDVEFVGHEKITNLSRFEFEKVINSLQPKNPNILLALLPDNAGDDEEDWVYGRFKELTIGRDIPSQVIYESTLSNNFAVGNVVLGILGKTGNIPFVLGAPLPFADLVVGIDVAREKKKKLLGSMNATAIARIYFNDGDFLKYAIHDAPMEGETIPAPVLRNLFPIDQFTGKRVVIHRDGYFRGNEKPVLAEWAKSMEAKFYFVEILKTGAPRLYFEIGQTIGQPPKGTIFKISDTEAFLVSSLPPFKNATPQPLQIRTDVSLGITNAVHSVLALTLLHYGSIRQPRLPVTVHYSDKIGYLALRGIKPKSLEGDIPFWL